MVERRVKIYSAAERQALRESLPTREKNSPYCTESMVYLACNFENPRVADFEDLLHHLIEKEANEVAAYEDGILYFKISATHKICRWFRHIDHDERRDRVADILQGASPYRYFSKPATLLVLPKDPQLVMLLDGNGSYTSEQAWEELSKGRDLEYVPPLTVSLLQRVSVITSRSLFTKVNRLNEGHMRSVSLFDVIWKLYSNTSRPFMKTTALKDDILKAWEPIFGAARAEELLAAIKDYGIRKGYLLEELAKRGKEVGVTVAINPYYNIMMTMKGSFAHRNRNDQAGVLLISEVSEYRSRS